MHSPCCSFSYWFVGCTFLLAYQLAEPQPVHWIKGCKTFQTYLDHTGLFAEMQHHPGQGSVVLVSAVSLKVAWPWRFESRKILLARSQLALQYLDRDRHYHSHDAHYSWDRSSWKSFCHKVESCYKSSLPEISLILSFSRTLLARLEGSRQFFEQFSKYLKQNRRHGANPLEFVFYSPKSLDFCLFQAATAEERASLWLWSNLKGKNWDLKSCF